MLYLEFVLKTEKFLVFFSIYVTQYLQKQNYLNPKSPILKVSKLVYMLIKIIVKEFKSQETQTDVLSK